MRNDQYSKNFKIFQAENKMFYRVRDKKNEFTRILSKKDT